MHDLPQQSVAILAPQKPKLRFWQFRLRELLLAMIATSAVLMVAVQNFRSIRPSPIYGAVRAELLIPNIASSHGLTNVSQGGGGVGESASDFATETSSQNYAIPESFRAQIKRELREIIQGKIVEYGGHEEGHVTAGDTIMLRYTCGKRTGMVYIAFFSVSPEIWRVNSLVVETSK